jgi:hypothetical protein
MSSNQINLQKIKKTDKQKEAIAVIAKNKTILLEGGSRSGKTFIILFVLVLRAICVANSKHLISRFRFAHAKQSICYETMPKVLSLMGISGKVTLNRSDWFYEFPNKSTIWINGLDDKDRTEKMLGNEYDTIYINEGSQTSYAGYEILITRLNPSKKIHGKMLIDYNPPSTQHWGYQMFHLRKFPDGRDVPEADFAYIKMNPADNLDNISEDYLSNLNLLSPEKRARFLEGNYSEDSGTLIKRTWIKYGIPKTSDGSPVPFERIVIGVDPSGSVAGDEIGIVVAGVLGEFYYVLDDYSCHGTPNEWAMEVATAYYKWSADCIAAERNYGGDMVESTIRNVDRNLPIKLVTATRGKIIRAEPISALYEQGRVFHRIPLLELEDEYCTFEQGAGFSPNRLDAAVWALTELTGDSKPVLLGRA